MLIGMVVALVLAAAPATPASSSGIRQIALLAALVPGLAVTAPTSTSLGSTTPGTTLSAHLGTVQVSDTRGNLTATWTATVTATQFTTGTATPAQTIPASALSYWSGPATSTTGINLTATPGQLTAAQAQSLSTARTAFSVLLAVGNNTVAWNPTVVVTVPASAVAGTYTGTITHSVA
jgi:hypothetical protein